MSNFFTTQPYDLDLSRLAYQENNKDYPKKNFNIEDHINSELMINTQNSFERNNERINSLNNEISEYKKKLKEIPIYKNEISSLKQKITELTSKNNMLNSEINQLINKINQLENENNSLKISSIDELIDGEIIKQEKSEEIKHGAIKDDEIKGDAINDGAIKNGAIKDGAIKNGAIKDDIIEKEYITIDIEQIKSILYNKLTAYHEDHIEKLIMNYGLIDNSIIEKSKLSEILFKAIHL